jgi:Phosphatidylserine synthase
VVASADRIPAGMAESRAVTNALLSGLAAGHWRPRAWFSFFAQAVRRSGKQAAAHPGAVGEVVVLHGTFLMLGDRRGRGWVVASGALALTHLGLLGPNSRLGMANTLTLSRANLPVLAAGRPRWLGFAALGSDLLDGALARRLGSQSAFGAYADSLADAAFWIWYTIRDPRSRPVRLAGLAAWALPVLAVSGISVRRGRMLDAPRPRVLRPAAALQLVLALRAPLTPDPVTR